MSHPSRARSRACVQVVALCVLLASGAAQAANLGFLANSPISYMKQADLQALNNAAHTALDTKQDGEAQDWDNKGTHNSVAIKGTITPSDTDKTSARTCRKLTIVAVAKGQTQTQTWVPTACKAGDGKWQLVKQ
ncbi:RT0821/Lpp0805 family surface protein [Caballeronia sp.]|uniref:RT0821/Lpp0805 family surface protein n=1 Tax=Caballeronia sp. TaxID=1931223 RepID=UPI003C400251